MEKNSFTNNFNCNSLFHSSDEFNKHITFIVDRIENIDKSLKSFKNSKIVQRYYEVERDLLKYLQSPTNNFSNCQIKSLKGFIRLKLYEKFAASKSNTQLEKNINDAFQNYLKCVDSKDIKSIFGNQFSYSNLNVELSDIEQLTYILKAMENSIFSECKSFICSNLCIDELPNFLIRDNRTILKQKVRRLWRINYEIPVNNLNLESNFGYKLLNEKFLDLINERFNLFDSSFLSEEIKITLFDILIYSNLNYLKRNELNMQTFLNNSKKYIFLMGIEKYFQMISEKISELMVNKSEVDFLSKSFSILKDQLTSDFSVANPEIDQEKILICIFSFSIMLNNLMAYNLDTDDTNYAMPKVVFSPELKCSARERQFLLNILHNIDKYLLGNLESNKRTSKLLNKISTFSSFKINYMLENSIFSSLIKSYTKVIFDEELNKTKVNIDQAQIFNYINSTFDTNSDFQKMKEMFNKFLREEVNSIDQNKSTIKKITSSITSKFKNLYSKMSSKLSSYDSDEENINQSSKIQQKTDLKVKVNLSHLKLVPFDPINISTHICICINGHILEGDIEKLWDSFTINEKSMDYYFYHWREENNHQNFLSEAIVYFNKLKNNSTFEEEQENSKKNIFRRNKSLSKVFGKILAYIIASRGIFKFHVISLIGYSLGCNVIKHCLIELNKIFEYNSDVGEIIQNIVFIGGACRINSDKFKYDQFFKIISGRIVNCYSTYDRTLSELYSVQAIGVSPMQGANIEDYDLGELKIDHNDYKNQLAKILNSVNIQ